MNSRRIPRAITFNIISLVFSDSPNTLTNIFEVLPIIRRAWESTLKTIMVYTRGERVGECVSEGYPMSKFCDCRLT